MKKPLEFFPKKQRGMEEVMETFKYHIERKEFYDRVMALSTKNKKPAEIYRELNQKVALGTIYDWIKGRHKPKLTNTTTFTQTTT